MSFDWLRNKELQCLLNALHPARVVGGAVRNSILNIMHAKTLNDNHEKNLHSQLYNCDLLDEQNAICTEEQKLSDSIKISKYQIDEVDIATPHTPEIVMKLAKKAGFTVIPTGLQHGTVTCVGKQVYEVTTLRIDVKTDGRHAVVKFLDSWKLDAERRDLTINALYVDAEGKIYDYTNGQSDLKNQIIRFIGNPSKRIQEDYLRILRYFRFFAHYGKQVDAKSLQACRAHYNGLQNIAKERCTHELLKLLKADNPIFALQMMNEPVNEQNLWSICDFPQPNLNKMTQIQNITSKFTAFCEKNNIPLKINLIHLLRLSTFIETFNQFSKMRLSNSQIRHLHTLKSIGTLKNLNEYLLSYYMHTADIFTHAIILNGENYEQILLKMIPWFDKPFPINGHDIIQHLNLQQNSQIGFILSKAKIYFCKQSVPISKFELLHYCETLI